MRNNEKNGMTSNGANQLFGIDFHHFIEKQESATNLELAQEFGVSLKDVRLLKQKLGRS